jgi:hypothetical protein
VLDKVLGIIDDIIPQSAAEQNAEQDEDKEVFDMMIQYILYPRERLGEIFFLRQIFESEIAQNEGDEIENPVSVDME